jgi:hypothetical protein
MAGDVEGFRGGFADLDALLVDADVERALDFEASVSRGRGDQLHHGEMVPEGPRATAMSKPRHGVISPPLRIACPSMS